MSIGKRSRKVIAVVLVLGLAAALTWARTSSGREQGGDGPVLPDLPEDGSPELRRLTQRTVDAIRSGDVRTLVVLQRAAEPSAGGAEEPEAAARWMVARFRREIPADYDVEYRVSGEVALNWVIGCVSYGEGPRRLALILRPDETPADDRALPKVWHLDLMGIPPPVGQESPLPDTEETPGFCPDGMIPRPI